MAKSDDILKKYGITQVKGSEGSSSKATPTNSNQKETGTSNKKTTGTSNKKADDILSKYGITQVRSSKSSSVQNWANESRDLLVEAQSYFDGKWHDKDDERYKSLQDRIDSYISQGNSWISQYGEDDAFRSALSVLTSASNDISNLHRYYSQWDTEDDYIKGAVENREARQQRHDGNQKRIEEIDSELPWHAKTFLPSSVEKWFLSDEKDALMDEREALETENRMYERGEGGWVSKVSDDYYKVTQSPDFETGTANRNHRNPTRDELDKYDTLVDSSTWYYDENNVLRDAYGNEIVKDSTGHLVNPLAQDNPVKDRLGLFLSASERDIEEYAGTIVSGTWGNIIGDGLDGSWNQLSKDEIDIYYYLLNTSGQETADKYLSDMKTELNRRQTLAGIEQWNASYDEASLLEKIALNAATIPVKFLSNITGTAENAANLLRGEDINPYSFANSGMHFSQTVRGNTAEELDATGFKLPVIDFTLGDIYQTGMSRIDSALATTVFGGGGTVFLGMGAAQEEAYKLYKQGASAEQITVGAFSAGAAEAIFEKLSYGKLKEIETIGSPVEWVKSILIQGFNEASEEALTEVSNIISNALVMGSQSDLAELYKENKESALRTFVDLVKQTAHSAFGGFLGGLGAGVTQSTGVYVDTASQYRDAGRAIMSADGGVDALKNLANEVAGVSEAKMKGTLTKQAGKVSDKAATGDGIRKVGAAVKNISNETKIGRLYYTVQTANNLANASANQGDIAKSLQRKGFNAETANDIASALVAQHNGQKLNKAQAKLLESVENSVEVKKVISDIMTNAKSTMGQRSENIRSFQRDVAIGRIARAYGVSTDEAKKIAEGKLPTEEENLPDSHYEVSADGKTIDKDGNIVTIQGIASLEKGRMVLQTESGTVDASDVSYASQGDALVYEAVANLEGIIDTDTANKLSKHLLKLGDVSSDVYAKAIVQAYTYGYYGYGRDAMTGANTLSATLSEKQRNVAYGLGEQYGEAKNKADQANATAAKSATVDAKRATAPDGTQYQKVRFEGKVKKWGKKQKAEVAYIDFIANNFSGNTVHVFESFKDKNGKYVYEDSNGEIHAAPNGMYIDSTGDIYLDLNAGNHGEGLVMNTFAHELYHHIQRRSPEKARKLAEFLVQELGYESVEAAVQRQIEKAERAGHGVASFMESGMSRSAAERLVYDRAFNDFVADSLETMFTEGDALGKLQNLKSQDEGLFNMIKDFINKWVKKLREFYRSHSTISIEGDLVRQLDKFEQIQQMFVEALVDAGENYQSLMTMEENTDAVSVEEVTQYSYRSLAEAAGFEAVENEDGTRSFLRNGVKVSEVTVEDIEHSPIGAMINYSLEKNDISEADAKEQKKMFAKICTMACQTNDFAMTMQFVGSAVFTGMKANADKQYGTTYDFPSICTKTQAVIDAMSKRMVTLGRGLSSDELVKLYQDVFTSGNPVPCPECYVFSRWIGIGGLLDNIKKYQDFYGNMAVEDVAAAYRKMREKVAALAEEQGITFGKAKGALTSKITKEYNKLTEKIEKAQNQGEKVKPAEQKRLEELEPMMNTVKGMTWLENVYFADSSLKKVNPDFRVPDDVLFDLNKGEVFATKYKAAWAFRTTQGAGYGKAITPYAEARLGEGILVTNNTTNTIKGKAQGSLDNYFLKQSGKLDKKARAALDKARVKQKIQAFIGGQRFQSTSDARYENASDYLLAALEMQAMGGMVQVYTKVDGAVPAFSAWGFSINQSLMPLGGGLDAAGKVKDTSVGGMNRDIAFRNRDKHETAGTITIGVNDNHIRAMFKQWARDFIIPYHASGGKADVVAAFRSIQEGQEKRGQMVRSTDYSRTQSDKILSDEVLRWQGKSEAEIQHIHAVRAARIAILTGGKVDMDVVRSNRFLSALYDKLAKGGEWEGVKLAKSKVESQIFPNEFWDQSVSYEDSGKVTRDYLEYCDDLGFLHRFSGTIPSNGKLVPVNGYDQNGNRVQLTDLAYKYDENGQKTDQVEEFFWKVLTDRRMYDNQGKYLPQKVVTLNDTTPDTVTTFAKGNYGRQYDKELSMKTAEEIAGKMYSDRGDESNEDSPVYTGEYPNGVQFQHREDDPAKLKMLNDQIERGEYTTVYKALLRIGDTYYPPMASLEKDENGKYTKLRGGQKLFDWIASDGKLTEEMKAKMNMKSPKAWLNKYADAFKNGLNPWGMYGDFKLKKADESGKSQGDVPAAYNPYQHSSDQVLNDQFDAAYDRPGLVVVECRIPNSELTDPYWAPYAKDPTGMHEWKTGPIAGQLKKTTRHVYMTRWIQPIRELSHREVAERIRDIVAKEDTPPRVYWNNINPKVLQELINLGVEIDPYGSPNYLTGKNAVDMYGNPITDEIRAARKAEKEAREAAKKSKKKASNQTVSYSDRDITEDPLYPDTEREKGVFNREFVNKISGLKPWETRDIMVTTADYFYFVRAYGTRGRNPYRGEILCKVMIDGSEDLINGMRKEISNGTYNATKEDDLPYEEAQRYGRRDSGRRASLRERLDAEGYGHLLDDPSDGDIEGVRGQGSGDSQSSGIKLSDRDYLDAVNRGDMETAQRLVDEAAKKTGYTIKAYHGTPGERFTVFDDKKIGSNTDPGIFGRGFYFTTHKDTADVYATESGNTMPVYLRVNNPWWAIAHRNILDVADELGMDESALTLRGYGGRGKIVTPNMSQSGQFTEHLLERGYDSVVVQHGKHNYEIVMFDTNRVKSSEPVTYDDSGNVIPLSERFKAENEDIRYSDRDTESVSNRSLLANALEGVAQNDIERNKIQEYKGKIDLINAEERKLSELNEKIKDLSFSKGPKDTKAIRDLQFEARQTANRINTYDKQLLRLEASKPLQDVLTREKRQAYKRAEQKGKEALAAYRERATKTQRELMDKWQESRKRGIESREKTAMRHKIQSVVGELNQLLLSNDKKRHVPENLKKAVADALALVNMDTVGAEERAAKYAALIAKETDPDKIDAYTATMENILRQGEKMGQRLKDLRDAYEEIQESDDPDIANAYDPVIAGCLKELSQSIGNTSLRDMTIEQLSDVYDMYRMVLTRVRDANKSFLNEKKEAISNLASRVVGEVRMVGGEHKMRVAALDPVRKFMWNNLKPVYAFEHMGSDTLTAAFNTVRKGEDVWAKDVTEAREYYLEKTKKYGYDSWDFKKKYRFESTSGQPFELTLEQILSLYAYSKREQSHDHLRLGGFVFDSNIETYKEKDSKSGKSILKYMVNTADAHQISTDNLARIISTLSSEQMAFVDEMQDYLSTTMGAKGNEVTMKMYGVKLFKEKFYFPLKSARQFMFEQNEVSGEVKIKNSGFTNKVVAKANNPVILSNFMDVWSGHVNDMSMYHAFVLPLEDFNRIFNYNSPKKEGQPPVSVKGTIQSAYSPAAVSYVKQLITDLNGGARSDPAAGIINKMMGLFKKGSVFASLSVVVQQPSAIARAAALVDTKHFIGPKVDHKRHKDLWDELKKYAPVAIIKEMGYFDTNMGKSTQDFIQGKEYSGFKEKMKALVTDSNYRDEILSKAPALADEVAWCSIWEAVKRETKAKHPGLDAKSEPFLMLAGSRFTEVIAKTQVYDSILSRSANMRSKDTGMKMATAFMAEPTTSINMIADALLQGKRGNRKYARAAIGAVIASQLLNSILVSFVYAGRDDDEDETYAEKYIGTVTGEFLDSLNPAGYIPFIKDIQSIVQGYDVERSDMAVISDLWNAWQNLSKDNVSVYRKVEGFAGSIAQIFGLPVKNIMRDVRGIYQTIDSFVNGQQTTGAGIGYAVKGAITGKTASDQQQLYEAYMSGDREHITRVSSRYKDQNAAHSALRKALRENDPRIREAAIAWNANDLDEYMRIAKQIIGEKHFTQDDVVMAIRAEASALAPDTGSSSTSKAKGLFTAEKFVSAIAQGDEATANAAKLDIIQTAQTNGKTEEEAEKSFVSSVKSEMKEQFLEGTLTEDQAIDTLIDYCGETQEDAEEYVGQWAFQQEYGFSWSDRADAYKSGQISAAELQDILVNTGGKTEEEAMWQVKIYDWQNEGFDIDSNQKSVVEDYETFCEPAGIDKHTYFNAYLFYADSGEEGVAYSKTIECMPYIDSLPLSSYQKTALAKCWWAESTVNKYKTW